MAKTTTKPTGKSAPKASKAAPSSALLAKFNEVNKEVDADLNDAFGQTAKGQGGQRFTPPDGDYIFEIVEGSDVIGIEGKDGKDGYSAFLLAVRIDGADDADLIDTTFNWFMSLKVWEDDDGSKRVQSGGLIKEICEQMFGSEIPNLGAACAKIAEEGIGQKLQVRVATNKKGYANYYFNGLDSAE